MIKVDVKPEWYSKHFLDFLKSKQRYQILYGGRGSGKTHHIILKLILLSFLQEYNHIIYVNKIFGDIRKNQFKDIIKVLKALELSKYFTINKTNYGFKNNLTGTEFTALGMDNAENTKGLSDPTIIWWDEINKGTQEDFTTLNALLRTPLNNKLQFIISFNPVSESSWLRKYFFSENNAYDLKPEIENAYLNHSTYLNNDFIDKDAYIKTLEINALGNVNRMLVDIKGLWGTILNNNPFFYALNRSKHYLPNHDFKISDAYVDLSFDFNKTPSTIVCGQVQKDGYYIFDCLFGDVNTFVGKSALEAVCTMFKNKYPQIQSYKIRVTGDASGRNGTADNKLNVNYYTTIKKELRLYDNQIDPFVRKANLSHGLSGFMVNTFLTEVPIYFVGDALILLDEMERAEADEKQTLNTWKRDTAKSGGGHAVDSARYLITDLWINSNEKLWREKITQISRSFIR